MKTVKLFIAALAISAVAMAAAPQVSAQENEDGKYGPYLTNGLWDNWFVDLGAGVNLGYDNADWKAGFALNLNAGKWFDPCFGARVGYNGITGMDGMFGYFHLDGLWNISNTIDGYKEDRFWSFVPYIHAGLLYDNPVACLEWGAGAGLLNLVRLSDLLDLTLDVRGNIYKREGKAGYISAAVGLAVNLGETKTWTRASEYHNPEDVDKISAAEASIAALTAANAALAASNANLETEKAQLQTEKAELTNAVKVAEETAGLKEVGPASFYFEIGQTKLSEKELKHLDFYMQNVLPNVKNGKATVVTGTADSNTGYAKRNQYLSKKRAEYMIDLLQTKYGIDTANIVVKNSVVKAARGAAAFDRAVVVSFE
ncbi:MAG: hypothetical protein E7118_02450 [Bacteroidales bacterium]|nr:hypothetical protein [Bacteroidales bacterium]